VDSVEFGREGSPDICVFGVEWFFEGVFGLAQGFGLSLIGFDIGGEVVELFLGGGGGTSTVESLFLSDIEVINISIIYHASK